MKAYMVQTDKFIEPFNEHPREQFIANRTLAWWQENVIRRYGLELVPIADPSQIDDPAEHLVVEDRLYFTPELLHEFVGRSRALGVPTRCALKRGVTTLRAITPTQGVDVLEDHVEYDLRYVPAQAQRTEPRVVVIDPDRNVYSIPENMEWVLGGPHQIALSCSLLVRIDHWTNILSANLLTIGAEIDRLIRRFQTKPRIKHVPFLLGALLRARSINRYKFLGQLNRIGKNCDIHPSAIIEGSFIGDNCHIGAGCMVRGSILGNNVSVVSAEVTFSVLCDGSSKVQRTSLASVLYPGAVTNHYHTHDLFGTRSMCGGYVALGDYRLDGRTVQVMKDGVVIDSEQPLLGSCIGHGTQLGVQVAIAPGRAVPNGLRIALDEGRMISKFPAEGDVPGYRVERRPWP